MNEPTEPNPEIIENEFFSAITYSTNRFGEHLENEDFVNIWLTGSGYPVILVTDGVTKSEGANIGIRLYQLLSALLNDIEFTDSSDAISKLKRIVNNAQEIIANDNVKYKSAVGNISLLFREDGLTKMATVWLGDCAIQEVSISGDNIDCRFVIPPDLALIAEEYQLSIEDSEIAFNNEEFFNISVVAANKIYKKYEVAPGAARPMFNNKEIARLPIPYFIIKDFSNFIARGFGESVNTLSQKVVELKQNSYYIFSTDGFFENIYMDEVEVIFAEVREMNLDVEDELIEIKKRIIDFLEINGIRKPDDITFSVVKIK